MIIGSAASALSPNLGLLDARATGRTLCELYHMFLPVDFFDLCSMIQEMVFRDRIVLVGKFEKLPKEYRAALQRFIDAGVFGLCVERVTIQRLTTVAPALLAAGHEAYNRRQTSSTVSDADYEVTRLLGAEVKLRIPTIPLLRHLHNYGFTRRPAVDHAVCDLSARFANVQELAEERLRFEAQRTRMRHISIPPIALEVLQIADTLDDLVDAILEKRHDYRHLRRKMTELSERLCDRAVKIEQHTAIVSEWERRWTQVTESSIGGTMGFGFSSHGALMHGVEFIAALEAEHWLSVAVSALKMGLDADRYRRALLFRPVHYSVRNYLRTGQEGMANEVGRLYNLNPALIHRQLAQVGSSTSVWRAAMTNLTQQGRRAA